MAQTGQRAQGHRTSAKLATPRHRVLSAAGADAIERSYERRVRQAARQSIDAGLAEYESRRGLR